MAQVQYVTTARNISAETHLLPALAGETIKALRDGPAHVDDIAARVFKQSARLSAATADLVATFADPGLETDRLLTVLLNLDSGGLARVDLA